MTPGASAPPDVAVVETPIGCVDLERVRANARRVAEYAAEHDFGWRPHIKTHKSRTVAKIQLEAGARGLTVATLREAEVMAGLTDDLLLAYPPVGASKLDRLMALPRHLDLKVGLDSPEVLDALAAAAREAGRTIGVLVEQDVGLGRVGLQTAAGVVALADRVRGLEGVRYRGIMFYPGHVRSASDAEQDQGLKDVSRRVRQTLKALRAAGLDPDIVSGGSTPTLWRSHELKGITEIRSGSCIYNDREGLDLNVATLADVAYTVLATVVSTAVPGHAVVDAGSKALAKEARGEAGYGILLDHPNVVVSSLSEEHGVLDLSGTTWRPRIGERVRIVPNHVCVSVNLQDRVLARDGEAHHYLELEGRGRGPWSG